MSKTKKPTIAELEAILNGPSKKISINPDGSITTEEERRRVMSDINKWRIDTSTGTPILTYEDCSVIQDEQAEHIMNLLSDDTNKCCAATPSGDLLRDLLDPNIPKSEREWFASREIARLEAENAVLRGKVEKLSGKRCEDCGSKVTSYPNLCPTCGAPECCHWCCQLDNLRTRAEAAERREAKLLEKLKELQARLIKVEGA